MGEIRLQDVIVSAVETFRDRVERGGIAIAQEIDSAGVMRGDPEKLRRVIINLISNAIDALEDAKTPDSSIAISAGENLAGTEVWLRVHDNGPGMDAETLDRIFNPFFTSKSSGTGLGLALSKKIVDAHGGSIEAISSADAGTEFLLTFPKQLSGAGSADLADSAADQKRTET